MSQQLVLDIIYVVLFIAVAMAEYFHILPQGTTLGVLGGFVVGLKTQSFTGANAPTTKGPSNNG